MDALQIHEQILQYQDEISCLQTAMYFFKKDNKVSIPHTVDCNNAIDKALHILSKSVYSFETIHLSFIYIEKHKEEIEKLKDVLSKTTLHTVKGHG